MLNECDFACEKNMKYIVIQCPTYEQDRKAMYGAIHTHPDGIGTRFAHATCG